jgi:hypothetical protein
MRVLVFVLAMLCAAQVWGGQPDFIRLNSGGISYIYPVLDTADWLLTQPIPGRVFDASDNSRITHWEDEFYAQDWARGCGDTYGARLYAGISGQVVLAGQRGPYGNTVVIYDRKSRFALKYSHLSEIGVARGEFVLAGKSFIGRVGNTGNVRSSGCGSHPGAHLHLALFKNVSNPDGRPITSTGASDGERPTNFAAPFSYVTQVELVKANNSATVFAVLPGRRVPVTAASFASNGWRFDKHGSLFDPLANRVQSPGQVNALPQAGYFWPLRDNALMKSSNSATVYQFEDGRKYALTYDTFQCRRQRFEEVDEVNPGERDAYLPNRDQFSRDCETRFRRGISDLVAYASSARFGDPDLATYAADPDWHPDWEIRWMKFPHPSGQVIELYQAISVHNPADRAVGFWDPGTGAWNGWHRVQ